MTTRRDTLRATAAFLGAAALPVGAGRVIAATERRVVRIGILTLGVDARGRKLEQSLADGLMDHGYHPDTGFRITRRTEAWPNQDLKDAATGFHREPVDVIVTACGGSTGVAVGATRTVPIVMGSVVDPVGRGFVRSLARPGTNVTGTAHGVPGLASKTLEYFRLAFPDLRRVGVIVNPKSTLQIDRMQEAEVAAAASGVTLVRLDVFALATREAATDALRSAAVEAVMGLPDDDQFRFHLPGIIAATRDLRLPSFFDKSDVLDTGATMSYGPDSFEVFRRSARYIDRIARGVLPADLAVEQPTKMELAISVRQAESLGFSVSRTALIRADTVVR